jgi:Tol biopolymer transport system component
MFSRHVSVLIALGCAAFPRVAQAQETASDTLLTVDHYLDFEQAADPQLSPDGSQIIYTRSWVNRLEDKWDQALWIMGADGSKNRFLTKGSNARWSPDGSRIAYFADGDPKGTQLFVRWMDAEGATSQVTHLVEMPSDLRWSPDGKWLSFAMLVRHATPWDISMPKPPSGATWTAAPRVVDRMHYRQDRRGFMEDGYLHLFLVSADGGTARQLTSGEWNVGARFDGLSNAVGYDWTPDGKSVVVDGDKDPAADHNYRNSAIYLVDVASGTVRPLTTRPGVWTNPIVSPDGKSIAFAGYDSSNASYHAADLWVMAARCGRSAEIWTAIPRDPAGRRTAAVSTSPPTITDRATSGSPGSPARRGASPAAPRCSRSRRSTATSMPWVRAVIRRIRPTSYATTCVSRIPWPGSPA